MKKILILILMVSAVGCKKSNDGACEKWIVSEYCVAAGNVACDRAGNEKEMDVCGDDLALAHAGKKKLRYSDGGVSLYTKFVRRAD